MTVVGALSSFANQAKWVLTNALGSRNAIGRISHKAIRLSELSAFHPCDRGRPRRWVGR